MEILLCEISDHRAPLGVNNVRIRWCHYLCRIGYDNSETLTLVVSRYVTGCGFTSFTPINCNFFYCNES